MKILNITTSSTIDTYLGCHNIDKRRSRLDFNGIKDKTGRNLSGWKARMLSKTGKAPYKICRQRRRSISVNERAYPSLLVSPTKNIRQPKLHSCRPIPTDFSTCSHENYRPKPFNYPYLRRRNFTSPYIAPTGW